MSYHLFHFIPFHHGVARVVLGHGAGCECMRARSWCEQSMVKRQLLWVSRFGLGKGSFDAATDAGRSPSHRDDSRWTHYTVGHASCRRHYPLVWPKGTRATTHMGRTIYRGRRIPSRRNFGKGSQECLARGNQVGSQFGFEASVVTICSALQPSCGGIWTEVGPRLIHWWFHERLLNVSLPSYLYLASHKLGI